MSKKVNNNNANPRLVALTAINATIIYKKTLTINSDLLPNNKDKSLAKSLAFGTIRYYFFLVGIVNKHLKKSLNKTDIDIYNILLLGSYQLLFTRIDSYASVFETVNLAQYINKLWAKSLINAILRAVLTKKNSLLQILPYSHPSWLVKQLKQAYPDDYQQIMLNNNHQAPMAIRVNANIDIANYQKKLLNLAIKSNQINLLKQALILEKAVGVALLPDFSYGACYVQDASAQLAAHILAPKNNDYILDAAAAPGGKTIHLKELAPDAKIIALDSNSKRITRLVENVRRHNADIEIKCGLAQNNDWWDNKQFTKILLDAPCSATGIIRRHPDIKLLRKPKDITALVKLQREILANLWTMLADGGTLLYATCSILPAENSEQIKYFLAQHKNAKCEPLDINWGITTNFGTQQLPNKDFDGFYYAKLIKRTTNII